jgi:hypothetical protein
MVLYADADLTTLDAVKAQLSLTTSDATDDRLLQDFITAASDLITQYCARSFVPYQATRLYDALGEHLGYSEASAHDGWTGQQTLTLDEDLLEVVTLTNGDSSVITSAQYVLRGKGYPKWMIELLPTAGIAWTYNTNWQNALSVNAIWGFHEDYSRAWVSTGDVVQDTGGINASVQSITVTDADGKDARYRTRFQTGMLLKIESEYLKVVAVNTSTNALTVLRGVNGTTAATHAKSTAIGSFAPMRNIEQICIALTAWLYRNRGTAGDSIQLLMDGTKVISGDVPVHIRQAMDQYARVRVR